MKKKVTIQMNDVEQYFPVLIVLNVMPKLTCDQEEGLIAGYAKVNQTVDSAYGTLN